MDDRRFDSLARALASGRSRRAVIKGLLGFGGAVVGGAVLDNHGEAARRPSPTPKPVTCPGNQTPVGGVCTCPPSAPHQCVPGTGPACCTSVAGGPPLPTHTECCDNACCHGTCYGEELCCPTNNRSTGEFPIPPTHRICNGTECCEFDQLCCAVDGCCDTVCSEDGHCCDPESVCAGDGESPDLCCVNNLTTSSVCCGAGTNANACFPGVVGVCCDDSYCSDSCQICDLDSHTCVARCDLETEICCTGQNGTAYCVTGDCCVDDETSCGGESTCCQGDGRTACVQGDTCGCLCEDEAFCCPIDDIFFTCIDLTLPGACCTGADCGEDETCCHGDGGPTCVSGDNCDPVVCTCENRDECCFRDGLFYACVDLTQELACCIDADCDSVADPENCIFGSCIDFICQPMSTCAEGQTCCAVGCVDGDVCPDGSCQVETDCASLLCCNGGCCAENQHCCDGACSDLECETSTSCSDDFDCPGDAVCCVGDCCTAGQSCVTDPNNNSYCA